MHDQVGVDTFHLGSSKSETYERLVLLKCPRHEEETLPQIAAGSILPIP